MKVDATLGQRPGMTVSGRFRARPAAWLLATALVVAAQFALVAVLIQTATARAPYFDEWVTVDLVHLARHGALHLSDLWANHGEHIILVPRLVNLPLALLTGWDRQAMMLIQLAAAIAALGLLLAAQRDTLGPAAAWLAPPTALLLLSCANYENWLSPFQLAFLATAIGAYCCTWAFARPGASRGRFAIALAGALVASFSSLAGAVLWPAFAPAVWWSGRRRLAIWLPAGGLAALVLATGLRSLVGAAPPAPLSIVPLIYIPVYLGLPLAYPAIPIAFLLGALGGGVGLAVAWGCRRDLPRLSGWLGLLAFAGGCAAVTALGRANTASRYLIFAALWWVALAVLLADRARDGGWLDRRRPRARAAAGLGAALLLFGLLAGDASGFRIGQAYQEAARRADPCVLAYAMADPACLRGTFPIPDYVRVQAATLAADRLGPFAGMAATPSPLPLVGSPPPDRSAWQLAAAPTRAAIIWCHVVTGAVHQEPVVLPPGSPLAIGGWAVDDAAGGPAAGVTIAIDGVPLLDAEYGGETPGWFAPQPYPASGFRAIVPAADLTPGRHTVTIRVLARDGRHYYAPSQRVLLDVR